MLTPWVSRIIFANVAIFVALMFVPALNLYANWMVLVPADILERPWTLVTYAFLHNGFGHIFFNMLVLFMFGPRVEAQLGPKSFLALYLIAAVGGGLLSYITPFAHIIGASGANLGVMYAFAKYWPRSQIYIFGFVPIEARIAIIIMVALDLWGGVGGSGNVAHFAHIGGFIGGYVFLRVRDIGAERPRIQEKLIVQRTSREDVNRWAKIRREQMHEVNREEYDRIMEKIDKEGISSVTPQERTFLDTFSERATASS